MGESPLLCPVAFSPRDRLGRSEPVTGLDPASQFHALDRETDTTLVLPAAPSHTSKHHLPASGATAPSPSPPTCGHPLRLYIGTAAPPRAPHRYSNNPRGPLCHRVMDHPRKVTTHMRQTSAGGWTPRSTACTGSGVSMSDGRCGVSRRNTGRTRTREGEAAAETSARQWCRRQLLTRAYY
jgi:hypothetical protein